MFLCRLPTRERQGITQTSGANRLASGSPCAWLRWHGAVPSALLRGRWPFSLNALRKYGASLDAWHRNCPCMKRSGKTLAQHSSYLMWLLGRGRPRGPAPPPTVTAWSVRIPCSLIALDGSEKAREGVACRSGNSAEGEHDNDEVRTFVGDRVR